MLKKFLLFFKKSEPQNKDISKLKSPYEAVKVWFEDQQVWVQWPSKEPESIKWDAIIRIAIETNDQGPFVEDVYWLLASKEKVISYPNEATGTEEMLKRLQEIPTFNNERLIDAMTCTDNQTFILWDHEGRHK
jgi:hypothetical protein